MLNKIRKSIKKINDSYEFKPLLSEIEESPVSPLGRFTFWTVVSLIIITIFWLVIGKIDIVITARGIVIPDGEAKIIQPLETGVVKEILVKEGDCVKQGDLLVLIDTMATDAQLKTVKENLKTSKNEAERLKSQGLNRKYNSKDEIQRNLYNESLKALNNLIGAKNQEIKQIERQIDSALAQKRDYENQFQSAVDREKRLSNVKDIVAYNDFKEAQDKTIGLKESVNRANAEVKRLQAQKRQIQNEIIQLKADFKAQKLENLTETNKRIKELEANKEQIEFSNINQKIIAPVDGFIDKLMIHTIGGVVTPAQELIALTPVDAPVLIKATVLNKDIGFVKIGMPVSIKIDTYDFQKYGLLHGKVKLISQNSIEDEDLGPVYEIYITPNEDKIMIDDKMQKISTGMTLSAEIEIGKRRIIEFFIYPLVKYMDEGVSVR